MSPENHRKRARKVFEDVFEGIVFEDEIAALRRAAAQERMRRLHLAARGAAIVIVLGVVSSYLASALWDAFPFHHHGDQNAQAAPVTAPPPKGYLPTKANQVAK